jgi:hypothetical protein
VALLGSGSGVRVTSLEVRDTARCADPVPRPALIASSGVALSASAVAWSRGVVGDPAVVQWQGERHLYFTGQTAIDGPRSIGHARWSSTGAWIVEPADRPILGPGSDHPAWGDGLDLTGPAPVILPDGRLVLYASLGDPADDDGVRHTSLVGAASEDGVAFTPLAGTATTPAGHAGVVLEPVTGPASARDARPPWERALRDPVVVVTDAAELPVVLLYAGRADPLDPFTSQIGLARSADGVGFERDHVVRLDPELPARNEPVLSAPADAVETAAVSRPAAVWDATRKLLLAWYATRVEYTFSIRHAVSVDGRTWAPFPENPVLQPGLGVWCDDEYLDAPWALLAPSGALEVWYHGRSATLGHGICLAENGYHD